MLPVLTVSLVVISLFLIALTGVLRRKRLPPGPRGLPVIGNLLQLPRVEAWRYYGTEMLGKYGDVTYLEAFGQPVVILNSYDAAHDLFVKRSSIYSDRPVFPVCGGLMGATLLTGICPYGGAWRAHRRLWHQFFGAKPMEQYDARIEAEARAFAARLLENDRDVCSQLKLWVVRSLVDVIFGIRVNSLEDELVTFTESVIHEVVDSTTPGMYLADTFPILVHVPEWFPGAGWKRHCAVIRDRLIKMLNVPYECTRTAVRSGDAPLTFVSDMLEDDSTDETTKKGIAASAYGAGVDTTLAAITRFVVNMMLHPEIQRRAQEEIDACTGGHRLPNLGDKDSMPYIDTLIQEIYRWEILGPFGLPHRLVQDDEYRGYTIPKGTMLVSNLWTISRDPEQYPNPDEFKPERFFKSDADNQPLDPRLYCFGIGRRVCTGRYFADNALYMAIVSVLATSTILKPLNEKGEEYIPEIKIHGETIRQVQPFEVRIRPRSAQAVEQLHESLHVKTMP